MSFAADTQLGPYKIIALIGSGGMGEVYQARDTRLHRIVAIKVLPEQLSRNAELRARLEREARTISSLNHSNICHLYDIGCEGSSDFLVMELVEGPTLADRIARSAMALTEALPIAKQICEALEYAHERGIVHRDLKPANVKMTPDDAVKLLDFGLAKALEGDPASADIASSPTITRMATQAGIILGTAAYMSPEQAKGKSADRRSDIWAFGCVLYEMLAGKMAFGGETVADTLASVIKSEPDWSLLPARTPLAIRGLLQRCLRKDTKQRLQAIGDVRIAIEEAMASLGSGEFLPAPLPPRSLFRRTLPWTVALATCALLAAGVVFSLAFRTSHMAAMHFRAVTNFAGVQAYPALSPDGRSVAFVSNRDGHYNIYVGLINGGNLVRLTDDPDLKARPCWSPEGTEIAYARLNDSGIWDIWKVPALGGTPLRVTLNATDPAWSHDGHSLAYVGGATGSIWIADSFGQNARELASSRSGQSGGGSNGEPRFSPNDREIAFAFSSGGPYGEIKIVDVNSGRVRQLTNDGALAMSPAWSGDGRFVYFASSRGGTLNIWKMPENGGAPEQITAGQGDDADLDVSADGKRIIFSTFRENTNTAQVDLNAEEQTIKLLISDPARNQMGPVYSPDGKHLAYFSYLKGVEREGIWVANADGSNPVQLVQDGRVNIFPRWTPDSKHVVYASIHNHVREYRRISIYGGVPQTVVATPDLPARSGAKVSSMSEAQDSLQDVVANGQRVRAILFQGPKAEVQTLSSDGTETLFTVPQGQPAFLFRWSPDQHAVAYIVGPTRENDPNAGLWVSDLKNPPRQIFRGWVNWYARGPKSQLYFIEAKPDLNGVLWKVNWNGQGLSRLRVRLSLIVPMASRPKPFCNFDISPDGQHMAFNAQAVLQANIGMLENVH